jgi:hypothetical protein
MITVTRLGRGVGILKAVGGFMGRCRKGGGERDDSPGVGPHLVIGRCPIVIFPLTSISLACPSINDAMGHGVIVTIRMIIVVHLFCILPQSEPHHLP